MNSSSKYDILAESDKGPQIAEHMNHIATQFHIDKEYIHSVKIIENFVKAKIETIQGGQKIDITLGEAEQNYRNAKFKKGAYEIKHHKIKNEEKEQPRA